MTGPTSIRTLLDSAATARAAGRRDEASRLYDRAAALGRDQDDLGSWTEAVLGAASVYVFGAEPGRLPAQLFDVLSRTTVDADRARLCAALARCWAYAGRPERAAQFAEQAVATAEACGDPELLADCLDSALAAHWGPDELGVRRALAAQLDDVAAHVLDPDARLRAVLWGLQVACEALDVPTMHRQMRALELLGEESPRALFFAASRRLMLDLLRGRTDTGPQLIGMAEASADRSSLADAPLVLIAMRAYFAAYSGDLQTCLALATEAETLARAQGFTVVSAEAVYLWACGGDRLEAARLLQSFHGSVLDELPRDVNWLLVLQCVLEAALFVGDHDVIVQAAELLAPYEGRAVFNAGAVMFHGVTDDPLSRAARVTGDTGTAQRLHASALATYERLGAQWWTARLSAADGPEAEAPAAERRAHLRPTKGGQWLIGLEPMVIPLSPLRGFSYLRDLLSRPGVPIAALDLVGAGRGVVDESGLGELVDGQALAAYRRRLHDLDAQLADADLTADQGRSQALHAEREALLAELARATGLGGRPRTTGSSAERARVSVKKSVTAAVDRIATVDEPLARHLRSCVRTGLSCAYEPDPDVPVEWVLA